MVNKNLYQRAILKIQIYNFYVNLLDNYSTFHISLVSPSYANNMAKYCILEQMFKIGKKPAVYSENFHLKIDEQGMH